MFSDMKGLKRYGGEYDDRGHGANNRIGIVGVLALVICSVFSLFLGQPGFIVVGFALLFIFMAISMFLSGGDTSGIREERHALLINQAFEAYEINELEVSYDLYNKSKIYKALAGKHVGIYNGISKKLGKC